MTSTKSFVFGVLGWPLGHSWSPGLHRAALVAARLKGAYLKFPISPDAGTEPLADLIGQMRAGKLHGLNVTIPYKKIIQSFVDRCTPTAAAVGAVNTVFLDGDAMVGDNTDVAGFMTDLQALNLAQAGAALVLGAGGASRAVVYGLLLERWHVVLAARRLPQAQQLCADLAPFAASSGRLQAVDLRSAEFDRQVDSCTLVINATPVGMYPDIESNPWPSGIALPAAATVYDLVYNPLETAFYTEAVAAGLPARTGLGMLIEQAALSFERWTGREASRPAMRAAAAGQDK